jgi:hypothetical protein
MKDLLDGEPNSSSGGSAAGISLMSSPADSTDAAESFASGDGHRDHSCDVEVVIGLQVSGIPRPIEMASLKSQFLN